MPEIGLSREQEGGQREDRDAPGQSGMARDFLGRRVCGGRGGGRSRGREAGRAPAGGGGGGGARR